MKSERFDKWISDARRGKMDDGDIARLAEFLASSGERLPFLAGSADLASTGGPGSISTLWAPATLVAMGATVAKLGVPGRPAGGVDVLMQLQGYRTDFDAAEAGAILQRCGYVHLLAGTQFAPADAALFSYRQKIGAQDIPALAIASLLSKKLSTGTAFAGLEVRIALHGNFGPDRASAAHNALRYCNVARMLGITGTCFLTDGTTPQQPYLGRGEALLAVSRLLTGAECGWLGAHANNCEAWSARLTGQRIPTREATCNAFIENVSAQGGSIAELHERAVGVAAEHIRIVTACVAGVVRYDLGMLRQAILSARRADQIPIFDDSAGLVLLVRPGAMVGAGEPLVSVRCTDEAWDSLHRAVAAAVKIGQNENDGSESTAEVEIISV